MARRASERARPTGIPLRVRQWSMDAFYGSLGALLPVYAVVRAARDAKARSRWRAYLRDAMRRFRARVRRPGDRPCVWVHGVSVGEVKAAARLVEEIEATMPHVEVVISVTTDTGRSVAEKRYPGRRIEFYPPDFSWVVNDALDAIRPDLVVLVESEFWPNFLFATRERGIPVALVNGRMSERSSERFRRLGSFSKAVLGSLDVACVQMPQYAERFLAVGVDPARVHVTGNMKFDNIPIKHRPERNDAFARLVGRSEDLPIITAGSTHPGEERALARIHRSIMQTGPAHRLVVAPRHPVRADTVEADMRREGADVVRRSRLRPGDEPRPGQVVLWDTVGELERVYAQSDLVFVGGSLVNHGGQNMMEPASLGRPVVVGPSVHNFRGEVEMLLAVRGLIVVSDATGVEQTLREWLAKPDEAAELGVRARDAIERSKGATERTLVVLRPLLARVFQVAAVPEPRGV
ncbi:MAG: 3-deoxy-D-manno-octulosonic acid transferase [Planctomycetota bacterium]|nr:3-deoxy-D-manno-octulosonic acid transferase [Planctomycetota bacterium]